MLLVKFVFKELNRKSILTSMSSWSELYPLVSADSRFEDMLMQSGSTALDLFKFYVEDLKEKYYQHRKIVKEILQVSLYSFWLFVFRDAKNKIRKSNFKNQNLGAKC